MWMPITGRVSVGIENGRARLFKAYNIEALVSALLADHPRDGAPWQIVMIRFERKDP